MNKTEKIDTEKGKKQVPLRLSADLYAKLARWAEDDFRSVNGQIEYLLTQCVNKHYGKKSVTASDGELPV